LSVKTPNADDDNRRALLRTKGKIFALRRHREEIRNSAGGDKTHIGAGIPKPIPYGSVTATFAAATRSIRECCHEKVTRQKIPINTKRDERYAGTERKRRVPVCPSGRLR